MADYKFVDADQLDSDLSGIANAIRKKGGTSASMSFPNGFSSAINAISTGVTVQRKSGTFTINTHNSATGGSATVNCGFQPDVVYIKGSQGYVAQENLTTSSSTAIVFAEENRGNPLTAMPAPDAHYQMRWTRRSNGFAIEMVKFASDWSISVLNETFNYVAIKYT